MSQFSITNNQLAAGQASAADASLSERIAFIRKVYSLLALSIFSGTISSVITLLNPAFLLFVASNIFIFFIAEFGVLIASNFVKKDGTAAFVMMNIFTVLTGVTTAPIVYAYSDVALAAAVSTIVVFVALSIYTFVSKKDFSFLGRFLMMAIIAMIVVSLLNIFWLKSGFTQSLLSWFGVVVFSGFIIYETSNIMRVYPTNMAIQATLSLYISILNLFISLLRIFGGSRS